MQRIWQRQGASGFTVRAGLLWLCVLAMLAGTVDLHTLAGGHAAADLLPPPASEVGDATHFACDDGHTPATHVEVPLVVEVHRCEACLHRHQHRHGGLLAAGFHGAGQDAGSVVRTDRLAFTLPFLEQAPSRGPPAA